MKLEPANIVCPRCGDPRYMRHLVGQYVGSYDIKCINCNTYFKSEELYGICHSAKSGKTNGDKIRTMTDEELAIWLTDFVCADYGYAASARILFPLNLSSRPFKYFTPPSTFSSGLKAFFTPSDFAVAGISCIRPCAPDLEIAF